MPGTLALVCTGATAGDMLTSPFSLQPQSHLSEGTMAKAAVTKRNHSMIQRLLILLTCGYTKLLAREFPGLLQGTGNWLKSVPRPGVPETPGLPTLQSSTRATGTLAFCDPDFSELKT